MRSALIWALLLLCSLALPADILVLVHQKEAGPIVPPAHYEHPTWILWPQSSNLLQSNRLFSLPSGVDWQTGFLEDAFVVSPREARNTVAKRWLTRGWAEAVKRNLEEPKVFAVAPEAGEPSREVLKTSMVSPTHIPTLHRDQPWPEQGLFVVEARGRNPWDEVAALVRRAGGRAMVVEIPDNNFTMWSRFWLQGKGWPEGTPIVDSVRIPGLLPARNLMSVLVTPSKATWKSEKAVPADRWLAFGHDIAPVTLVFLAVGSIYVLGLGIYCALREQYSRIAISLVRLLVCGPAALILGGWITSFFAPAAWAIWHMAGFLAVVLGSWILNRFALKWIPGSHPLWGEFVVGAIVCGICDPVWSMFSNVLGPHRAPTSPEAFGALAAYLMGSVVLFPKVKRVGDVWVIAILAAFIGLLCLSPWLEVLKAAGGILGVVILNEVTQRPTEPPKKRFPILPFVFVLGIVCALFKPGLAYAPQGLVYTFAQFGKFNCAEQISFLLSPTFIAFCLVAIVAGIVGDNFLGHQARRAMAFSPKPKAFFPVACCFLVAGVFVPLYLHAFLATTIAGAVAVLFDAIRAP